MPITANQTIDSGWDFTAKQVAVPHPITGKKSGYFMNVREDTNDIVGWTTDRYGLVQHRDVIGFADNAFADRDIAVERRIIVSENGAKMRAVYTLLDEAFKAEIPQVGDAVRYSLTAQNSLDRSLRLAYILGLERLICTNGMTTTEKEVEMAKKHSMNVNLNDVLSPDALDKALGRMKGSLEAYGRLAQTDVSQEQGLTILQNLANAKVFSEKVREAVAKIWNDPTHEEDKDRNLYNLNNAVTQHLTHEVAGERFEYANRATNQVLKRFDLAARNPKRLTKLWTPVKNAEISVTE